MEAVMICKGENPVKNIAIVCSDGRKVLLPGELAALVEPTIEELKIDRLYSRSWDMRVLGLNLPYIHVKDHFCALTGTSERLSRFAMARIVGIRVVGGKQAGRPELTAQTYLDVFKAATG
jgi:hypothetical protein